MPSEIPPHLQNDPVVLAYKEIKAIADKYELMGIVVITTKDSSIVKSEILEFNNPVNAVPNTEDDVSSMFGNTVVVVTRTMRLVYRHLLKLDCLLQLVTKNKENFNEAYTTIESDLDLDIDEMADSVQAAGVKTQAEADVATLDNTPGKITATPRTINKLRQLNNAFIGNYFWSK